MRRRMAPRSVWAPSAPNRRPTGTGWSGWCPGPSARRPTAAQAATRRSRRAPPTWSPGRPTPVACMTAVTGTIHAGSGGCSGTRAAAGEEGDRGMNEIRASTVLPSRREPVTLHTADGLSLVGELALPAGRDPVATLVCLHPLPTHGGMMDSHIIRKASYRLPALADLAVLRFNTRGAASEQGRSDGEFGGGEAERYDVAAAIAWCTAVGLPRLW